MSGTLSPSGLGEQLRGTRVASRRPRRACARCGVVHCTSNSRAPSRRSSSTVAQHATFDASVTRWNIDSPANKPPIRTPYSPPTSSPSCHVSTLCAQPSSCSRVYAATNDSSIQPCGRRGSAHPRITASNAVSTRISNRGITRTQRPAHVETVERDHTSRIGRPPREHARRRASGTSPRRYASSTVPGSRSPPTAMTSSSPAAGSGSSHRDGGGSTGMRQLLRLRPSPYGCDLRPSTARATGACDRACGSPPCSALYRSVRLLSSLFMRRISHY